MEKAQSRNRAEHRNLQQRQVWKSYSGQFDESKFLVFRYVPLLPLLLVIGCTHQITIAPNLRVSEGIMIKLMGRLINPRLDRDCANSNSSGSMIALAAGLFGSSMARSTPFMCLIKCTPSSLFPELAVALWDAVSTGAWSRAHEIYDVLLPANTTVTRIGFAYGRAVLREGLRMRGYDVKIYPRWESLDLPDKERAELEAALHSAWDFPATAAARVA